MTPELQQLLERATQLLSRIEAILPQPLSAPDWGAAIAWRYRKRSSGHGALEPVKHVAAIRLDDPGLGVGGVVVFQPAVGVGNGGAVVGVGLVDLAGDGVAEALRLGARGDDGGEGEGRQGKLHRAVSGLGCRRF